MRALLLSFALALAVSNTSVITIAAAHEPTATIHSSAPVAPAVQKTKKKKNKDSVTVGFDPIQSVKKGKKDFDITVRVSGRKSQVDYTCELTLSFADGTTEEADIVEVNNDDVCELAIDIPDLSAIVGEANAHVVVRDDDGKKKGSDRTSFKVRGNRAG